MKNAMKRFLPILLFIIGLTSSLNAQWTSPGNGTTFTLPDLVTATDGVVTNNGTVFTIHNDLTISDGDVLKIDNQVTRIDAPGVLITINGTMECTNNERVKLYGSETQQNLKFSMRFENAKDSILQKLYLTDGSGIKLVESDVVFNDVKFTYFTTDYCNAVIDLFNSNPVIENCYFLLNDGAAVASAANGQSSPKIVNCQLDSNVNNRNMPQINLGPGGNDTIYIVGNLIDGTYATFHTGGVSVADLMGVGSTKVLLKDNNIIEGRYGYNQQGQTISSVISGNQFLNNNHESNPMNGGSGISIYGSSVNNQAILRNNTITGNLWGITAINLNHIDMGTEDDWGNNIIHDNGNNGTIYDLYNNSSCDIKAVGNNWGTSNQRVIEEHIVHQVDNPAYGLVTFIPFIDVDQVEEIPIDGTTIDLSKATLYSLNGQRLGSESLKPGVYIAVIKQGTQTIAKKILIQ